jgi:hypothetical protein
MTTTIAQDAPADLSVRAPGERIGAFVSRKARAYFV